MESSHAELWERTRTFEIDDGPAEFPFAARLARDNAWTGAFAERVVVEYRRFLHLMMVAGHPVTPSDQVDQAWHLHLTYTHSYWERLCGETLVGRDLVLGLADQHERQTDDRENDGNEHGQ